MTLNCTACYSEIEKSYIKCPECNSPYHEDCWKRNGYKCSEYGCNGKLNPSDNIVNDNKENNDQIEEDIKYNSSTSNITQNLDKNRAVIDKVNKSNNSTLVILLVIVIVLLFSYILFIPKNNNQPIQKSDIQITPEPTQLTQNNDVNTSANNSFDTISTSKPTETYNPTPEATENSTPIPEPTIDQNTYNQDETKTNAKYTIQLASRVELIESLKIAKKIPNSFIVKKYVNNQYRYAVVIGRFQSKDETNDYKKEIILNYRYVATSEDIPKAFIISLSDVEEVNEY